MPETQTGVAAVLGLNPALFIAQLVNFTVVLLVVWKWIYQPLMKTMDERTKKISDGLSNADDAKRRLSEAKAEQEAIVRAARQESKQLVDEARQEAERERARLMAETQVELERQLTDAKERLKREKETTITAVKNEVATLVMEATHKVTAEVVDTSAQRALIKQAVTELE